MNIGELLESRKAQWQELEELLSKFGSVTHRRRMGAKDVTQFTALYRGACADLALSEAYQLPGGVVQYLNDLVGRAHNQLYRDQTVTFRTWMRTLMTETPRKIFADPCFWFTMFIFWVPFFTCMWLGASDPDFAAAIVSLEQLEQCEDMYSKPIWDNPPGDRARMVGFYIFNNAWIGMKCFALGILGVVPGVLITLYNACTLGAIFGHMVTVEGGSHDNFFEFVTAHGPFELMAIVLAVGAGIRIGFSLIHTRGFTRGDAVAKSAKDATPIITAAVICFCVAAFIEGFISPVKLDIGTLITSHTVKKILAVVSAGLLFFYIIILGGLSHLAFKRSQRTEKTAVVE